MTPRWPRRLAFAGIATAVVVLAGVRVDRMVRRHAVRTALAAALPAPREGFVGSSACRACHPGAYESWHGTFHRTMTQPATEAAVMGAFDGRRLADGTVAAHDDEGFWFDDGQRRRRVVMTTGSHHMQVYWHRDASDGALRSAKWAWLGDEQRFVPNDATLLRPPAEPVRYTWNRVCIKCHTVAGVPGWDEAAGQVRSEVGELGIACEACHGPGGEHVARHRDPTERYASHAADEPDPTIVQPARLDAEESAQVCGQCHSITIFHDDDGWVARGRGYAPHDPAAHDPIAAWGTVARHPLRADQPQLDPMLETDSSFFVDRYWADGMVRVSGREYNGLLESPCFASGELSCLSCHSMHDAPADDQLRPAATEEVCVGCHAGAAADGHAHHEPDRVGCLDCHMPYTTYGLLKAIRSHEVDVPRMETSIVTGRPTACGLCHLDRSPRFVAEALGRWYGHAVHDDLADDLADEPGAIVGALAGDAAQRALWAWHLGWDRAAGAGSWRASILAELLDDPYFAVRIVAERALRRAGLPTPRTDPIDDGATARREVLSRSVDSIPQEVIERWASQRDDRAIRLAE